MSKRKIQLDEFIAGMRKIKDVYPGNLTGFSGMLEAQLKEEGGVNLKTKELICVALACYTRCEYCIVYHVNQCIKAGATNNEIMQAGFVSVIFGGGPSMSHVVTVLRESLEELRG
jgi:AhpD family alkylhydroperoxidase